MTPVERIAVEAIALLPGMPDDARRLLRALSAIRQISDDPRIQKIIDAAIGPDRSGRYVPRGIRRAVLARDGLTCRICGSAVEESDVHLDHLVPLSRGGRTTAKNLRVTHSRCNLAKGARLQ